MHRFASCQQVPANHPPCVYYLADPRTPNSPRYVGASARLAERLKSHHKASVHRTDDHARWWRALYADGLRPVLCVVQSFASLEEATRAEWRIAQRWQRYGVALFGSHVAPAVDAVLVSASMGCEGPRRALRASRRAMVAA